MLDQRVGIGDRGRLVAHHQQHFLGGTDKADDRLTDTRSSIDDQYIEVVADFAERLDQPGMLGRRQVDHALRTGGSRYDAHTTRALQYHVTQLAAPFDDIGQGPFGRQAQQHVDIGQAQVGIQQHDPAAEFGQRQGQVH